MFQQKQIKNSIKLAHVFIAKIQRMDLGKQDSAMKEKKDIPVVHMKIEKA